MSYKDFKLNFTNLVTMYEQSIQTFGSRRAFGVKISGQWTWVTYAEFDTQVSHFRSALDSLGVKKGDRVAVISNNRLEWAVGAYATYTLGATYVPMYETQLPSEWSYILTDCGAKVCLVANGGIFSKVSDIAKTITTLNHVVDFEGQQADVSSYHYLMKRGSERTVAMAHPSDDDIAAFIYTSGTTGKPKGVRLSHLNLASNICGMQAVIPMTENDLTLSFLPWAHVYGNNVELNAMISIGACMAICESNEKIVSNLSEVKPTVLFAVPRIWNRIYDGVQKQMTQKPKLIQKLFKAGMAAASKKRAAKSLSIVESLALAVASKLIFSKIVAKFGGRLQYAVSGAAALSREVGEFIDNLGIRVYEGYGMTETSPIISCNRPGASRIGTVGHILPGVEIDIDETTSEIIAYGYGVMQGYHNMPEETAQVLTADGGMRTGDMGRLDSDGFLHITGRVKEIYKLENGKYIAPAPLEEKITLSPFIAQAMVHGADRPFNVALIVPDMTAITEWARDNSIDTSQGLIDHESIRQLIRAEVDKYSNEFKSFEKVRKFKLLAEEFSTQNDMLTPTLKVKRRNVLIRYESELSSLWS
jgi:long-chain acyl-CoA synthetase